ncbi:SURF1 family protein [Octadecabacter sp.]|nr:SURF1 family protein [Octadecabacter sp.]
MTSKRPLWVDVLLLTLSGIVFIALTALGTWQVQRLGWKLDLIEQVEARAYAAPIVAPYQDAKEYQRVTVHGSYLHGETLRIKAVTELGPGFWVMTPMTTDNQTIWVNRGFVPSGMNQTEWTAPNSPQFVTGFVRLPIPDGTWLEKNDPVSGRWFSADIPMMSARADLINVAAYYIDAVGPQTGWPRGGLTKLTFRNTHLTYAITWYAMAALFAFGIGYVIRERRNGPD